MPRNYEFDVQYNQITDAIWPKLHDDPTNHVVYKSDWMDLCVEFIPGFPKNWREIQDRRQEDYDQVVLSRQANKHWKGWNDYLTRVKYNYCHDIPSYIGSDRQLKLERYHFVIKRKLYALSEKSARRAEKLLELYISQPDTDPLVAGVANRIAQIHRAAALEVGRLIELSGESPPKQLEKSKRK